MTEAMASPARLGIRALLFLSVTLVTACSTLEAGSLRTSENDGQGALVSGCSNVSQTARVDEYETKYYLTTYGSAWLEGASEGMASGEGRIGEAIAQAMVRPTNAGGFVFNELMTSLQPFCRVYVATRAEVANAIATALPKLGNPILVSDERAGIFRTDTIDRQHPAARWKDSYLIAVEEERANRVIVRILRSVYIARDTAYNQAESSGQNEIWIFSEIARQLGE